MKNDYSKGSFDGNQDFRGYVHPKAEITLRDYQSEAVESVWQYMRDTNSGNPLVVAPTGSGKSMIFASLCHDAWNIQPGTRIIMLTHVAELVGQNEIALKRYWPDAPVGVFSAGMGRKESAAPILLAGVQSYTNAVAKVGWADLVIVDEAHLIPKAGNGQYITAFKALRSMNPRLRVIGLTATPFRSDTGYLHQGKGKLFDKIVYDISLLDLMNRGHVSRVTSKNPKSHISTKGVAKSGGDFNTKQLEEAAMSGDNVAEAVSEVMVRGVDRRGWMFFASGKAHAEMIRDEVRSRGVSCEMVMGDTPKAERAHLIKTYKEQGIRAMVSVGVLTTGFDAPHVDLIALMRPTMSPGLHVQIVGRGLRKCEGKTNCLVLDFAGNIERHGPLDDIKVKEPGQGNGEAPIKACPQCDELVPAGALVCACCGFEFPPREIVKHQSRASYLAVVSDDDGPSDRPSLPVQSMQIARHKKVGKKDSVRVSYNINMSLSISEWLCFDHGVYMNKKAQEVWAKLGGFKPLPATTEEALERKGELMAPSHIQVSQQGKYERVEDRIFKKPEPPKDCGRVEISESDIPF
jgi:DNA repair protein RadD